MGVRRKGIAAVSMTVGAVLLIGAEVGLPARASTKPVQAGVATAGSAVLGVIPGVSGLALTTTFGESEAAYEETQSEGTSAAIDLGGLGYLLANSSFCGNTLPEKDLPQPVKANSGDGASSPSGGLPGVAQQQVSVKPSPEQAQATTTLVSATLPGILSVKGESNASVYYQANTEQEADSSVTADISLLGGLVDLDGATWTASRHSGAKEVNSGNFTLGKVTIGGVPLGIPNVSTAAAVAAINQAIGLLGFNVTLPTTTTGPGGATVGPLVIHFSGSAVERTIVNPVVNSVTDLEGELNKYSTPGEDCSQFPQLLYNLNNNVDTVINLALAISRGSGSLDLNLGGANAQVSDLPNFVNPFGSAASTANPLGGPSDGVVSSSGFTSPGLDSGGSIGTGFSSPGASSLPSTGGLDTPTNPVGSTGAAGPAARGGSSAGPVTAGATVCRSSNPGASASCSSSPATLAAALLLAGGGAVLAADVVYGHRRRRRRRSRERMAL